MARTQDANPISADILLMFGYNLMTLLSVYLFDIAPGNILWMLWVENVLMGITALIALNRARRTAQTDQPEYNWQGGLNGVNVALHPVHFLLPHGIFTAGHLPFTFLLGMAMGVEFSAVELLLPLLMVIGRHVGSIVSTARLPALSRQIADRRSVSDAMTRMLMLHMVVLAGWVLVLGVLQSPTLFDNPIADTEWYRSGKLRGLVGVTVLVIGKTIAEYIILRRSRRIADDALAEATGE